MNIEIAPNDIERSHRNGQSRQPGEKPRPIIVKFVRYNHCNIIFGNKKLKVKKLVDRKTYSKQNGRIKRSKGATWFSQCLCQRS